MLNLDISLIFVTLLVWFLMTALNRIFFRPIGQVIRQRESKIQNESNQIDSINEEIENISLLLEKKLQDAKKESNRVKEELMKKGEEARELLIIKTRNESQKLIETKMKELDLQIVAAEKKLTEEVGVFSAKLKETFIA
ncbi:MAG: ATP synthase F0 subunit B [Acidobacteria bacterium]|jgi:F-type H+-transporting ATPase subunit b|nr:ATP synthase F0 subunit B [Acidobacteriota bacterium]